MGCQLQPTISLRNKPFSVQAPYFEGTHRPCGSARRGQILLSCMLNSTLCAPCAYSSMHCSQAPSWPHTAHTWCADLQPPAAAQHCSPQTGGVSERSRLQGRQRAEMVLHPLTPILSHCEVLGGTAATQGCTEHRSKPKTSFELLTRSGLGPAAR